MAYMEGKLNVAQDQLKNVMKESMRASNEVLRRDRELRLVQLSVVS